MCLPERHRKCHPRCGGAIPDSYGIGTARHDIKQGFLLSTDEDPERGLSGEICEPETKVVGVQVFVADTIETSNDALVTEEVGGEQEYSRS